MQHRFPSQPKIEIQNGDKNKGKYNNNNKHLHSQRINPLFKQEIDLSNPEHCMGNKQEETLKKLIDMN